MSKVIVHTRPSESSPDIGFPYADLDDVYFRHARDFTYKQVMRDILQSELEKDRRTCRITTATRNQTLKKVNIQDLQQVFAESGPNRANRQFIASCACLEDSTSPATIHHSIMDHRGSRYSVCEDCNDKISRFYPNGAAAVHENLNQGRPFSLQVTGKQKINQAYPLSPSLMGKLGQNYTKGFREKKEANQHANQHGN